MSNHLYDGLLNAKDPASQFAEIPGPENTKTRYYSYRDVDEVSARFANAMVTLGVKPGDRVAVQVPKSIEAIMLYLGVVRAGGVFLPLNTAYTASEVTYFLEDAQPRVFVCHPDDLAAYKEVADAVGAELETMGVYSDPDTFAGTLLEAGLNTTTEFKSIPRAADDLAAILYTSGTTGRSKGAMLSHDNLLSNSQALAELWAFSSDDVLIHALPVFHTHGLFVATNVALISGASLLFLNAFSVDAVIEHLPWATSLMGVPTFYTRLLGDMRLTAGLVSHMRLFVSGSAPLLEETHVQFENRTGHRVLERYGMTETNMNTSNPYKGERRAGTVGFPLSGVDVRVADPVTGDCLTQDEVGVLEVKGPNVFAGYWNMPEKTAEEFRSDGYFITGDLGKLDADGYVHIVGREKDLIISGGYNIYPKEIELIIDEVPGVVESAVIGVQHPDFGEGVVAVVVIDDGNLDAAKILKGATPHLAKFKLPKIIHIVAELPRNTMGKVQKNLLREQYNDTFSG